jgi:WD40 repeat protein
MTTDPTSKMNEYERERAERIRQNMERMKAMDLLTLAAKIAPPKPKASQRGLSAKKRKQETDSVTPGQPRRRSARLQGEAADGSEVVSERHGSVIVTTKQTALLSTSISQVQAAPEERHPKGDVIFRSSNGMPINDEDFLKQLRKAFRIEKSFKKPFKPLLNVNSYSGFSLSEHDVAKVTKNSITHLAFASSSGHGSSGPLIVAAADKRGGIGLWNVDSFPKSTLNEFNDENSFDGVLAFYGVHYQYVSGLKWAAGSHTGQETLFTCSYDGSLRQLDPEKAVFSLVWGDEQREYSCFDVGPDGCTAYLGDNEGGLDVIDMRSNRRIVSGDKLIIHNRKVNTVHINVEESPSMIVTASTDATIALWDVRKMQSVNARKAKSVAIAAHNQTCQAAYFAPDGSQRVLSTSFDNTVRIWDGKRGLDQQVSIRHDNQTGRWVLPFRAVWGFNSDAVIVGNMHRFVDVYDAHTGELATQLSSEWMSAIPARNAVHPAIPVMASGTASGRVHVFRLDV